MEASRIAAENRYFYLLNPPSPVNPPSKIKACSFDETVSDFDLKSFYKMFSPRVKARNGCQCSIRQLWEAFKGRKKTFEKDCELMKVPSLRVK